MAHRTNHIYKKDCVSGLKRLPDGDIDLVFADPPFNIGYEYDAYEDTRDAHDYLTWSRVWMNEAVRTLKATGTLWLAIGDEYAAELKTIAQHELGLTCRSWVIWYYTFGVNCVRNFSRSHTHLFYFVKNAQAFTFNADDPAVRVPSARQLVYADKRANPKGRLPDNTWILRPQDVSDSFGSHGDTWYFPRVCGTFKERAGWHGCQMPEQLLGRIIRACSNADDVVLDPFGGSGTTYAVAKKLGRKWIGFEVSSDYVKRIRQRLSRTQVGDKLEGASEPLTSVPSTPGGATGRRGRVRAKPQKKPPVLQAHSARLSTISAESIKNAYIESCDGYSIDRLITDPALNQAFLAACRAADLSGGPADWNHRLLGLRKAGKFKNLPKPQRTKIPREQLDQFIFASEIAWHLVAEQYDLALDEILCEPQIAQLFDETAARFAPGFSVFQYRWGALWLRKKSRMIKRHARTLPRSIRQLSFGSENLELKDSDMVPEDAGLYLLSVRKKRIYLGSTLHLRKRIINQTQTLPDLLTSLDLNDVDPGSVKLKVLSLDADEKTISGLQARLIRKFDPLANYTEAFVA